MVDTSTVLTGWWDHLDVVDWHDDRWGVGPAHWTTVLVHDPDLLAAHLLPLLTFYADKPRADLLPVVRALGASPPVWAVRRPVRSVRARRVP